MGNLESVHGLGRFADVQPATGKSVVRTGDKVGGRILFRYYRFRLSVCIRYCSLPSSKKWKRLRSRASSEKQTTTRRYAGARF